MNVNQKALVQAIIEAGYVDEIERPQLKAIGRQLDVSTAWLQKNSVYKVSRGVYRIPNLDGSVKGALAQTVAKENINSEEDKESNVIPFPTQTESFIPDRDSHFVRFGHCKDVEQIVKSRIFYPTFVTGLSGNGKTFMVEQVCAKLNREMFRVNVTIETDEDDLLGHYLLKDGETVWQDGPVIQAMKRGAILLLDEVDLASNKIMCLQPVLEGKGIFIKKINKWIRPIRGFNVFATANTKGKGSDDGRFIGTNILNEAFLERFAITMEQDYPSISVEKKILNAVLASLGCENEEFVEKLTNWADIIRKTFYDGGVDEIIATRRLVHICNAYAIFGDKMKSIQMCVNRFDEETKSAFLDLYSKVDADVTVPSESTEDESTEETDFMSEAEYATEASSSVGTSSDEDQETPF
jgi:hypothetical protein